MKRSLESLRYFALRLFVNVDPCACGVKAAVTTSDNGDGRFDPGSTIV